MATRPETPLAATNSRLLRMLSHKKPKREKEERGKRKEKTQDQQIITAK